MLIKLMYSEFGIIYDISSKCIQHHGGTIILFSLHIEQHDRLIPYSVVKTIIYGVGTWCQLHRVNAMP